MTLFEVGEIENYINYMSIVSLETIIYSEDDDVSFMGLVEDKTTPSPEGVIRRKRKIRCFSTVYRKVKRER